MLELFAIDMRSVCQFKFIEALGFFFFFKVLKFGKDELYGPA